MQENNNGNNLQEFETPRVVGELVTMVTTFKVGDYVSKVARFELDELKRITRFAGNIELPSVQMIERYLVTLLSLRVSVVDNKVPAIYRPTLKSARIPARWFVLLSQIGYAKDFNRKFEFVPVLQLEDGFVLLTPKEMEDISWLMESLLQEGYTTVPGIPRTTDGSLQFMAKTKIGEYMRGMDKDNPAFAFLASLLEAEVASESYDNLDLVFRIQYSTLDTYNQAFQSYFVASTNNLNTQNNSNPTE
jgi:hypothetical protein